MKTHDNILPDKCDICLDKIPLYTPWYSVIIAGHFCKDPKDLTGNREYQVLCKDCFQAYKNFIIEHRTEENHKRNYKDMKGGN